jgi:arylsulfatase A-like enzyme
MGWLLNHSGHGDRGGVTANGNAPNILILVFDALSARNMSLYGYPRDTTPELAKFAENALVFNQHYSSANFTTPGTASILTGTLPWHHRAFHIFGNVSKEFEGQSIFQAYGGSSLQRVAYTHNDLAEMLLYQFINDIDQYLRASDLAMFHDQPFSNRLYFQDRNAAFLSERLALQGWDRDPASIVLSVFHKIWRTLENEEVNRQFEDQFPLGVQSVSGGSLLFLLEHAVDWLKEKLITTTQPFIAYLHFYPPHGPFRRRDDFIGIFDDGWEPPEKPEHFFSKGQDREYQNQRRQDYDEHIAYMDSEFGRLVNFMESRGLMEDSILVFTTDHGQMFERGITGHTTPLLVESLIHVPLVISYPGQQGRMEIDTPTSCIDLLPTLLHITGQQTPDWVRGQLLPPFSRAGRSGERTVFAVEAKENSSMAPIEIGTVAMRKGRYKLVHYFGYEGYKDEYELFDLEDDPEEMENLISAERSIASTLKEEMRAKLEEVNSPYS